MTTTAKDNHKCQSVTVAAGRPVVSSCALFGQGRQLVIEHQGTLYYLRITSNNKLILTK